jgi:hypothetical protein
VKVQRRYCSKIVLFFKACPRKNIKDERRKTIGNIKEVLVMENSVDMGWLVVITQKSRVNKLRVSAAMSMDTFAAFEAAGDEAD